MSSKTSLETKSFHSLLKIHIFPCVPLGVCCHVCMHTGNDCLMYSAQPGVDHSMPIARVGLSVLTCKAFSHLSIKGEAKCEF